MKKFVTACLSACLLLVCLCACGGGDVSDCSVAAVGSDIYSAADIDAAIKTAAAHFKKEFSGCTLTEIGYIGDDAGLFAEWAEQYEADEAIVLRSSFSVDAFGGDGSFEPNSTYTDWNWILVRSEGGKWRLVTQGYY